MYPQDESCRRLLLSEVLLEEYESLDQPKLDFDPDCSRELDNIKDRIKQCREISDVSASLALDGEIVSSFYRLMSKAQADQASKEGKEKYSEWQGNLKGVNAEGEAAQGDPAERAAVADIFGRIDDLRCKYEEEQAKLAEETDQQEKKDERKKTVDKKVLEDVAQGKGDEHEW